MKKRPQWINDRTESNFPHEGLTTGNYHRRLIENRTPIPSFAFRQRQKNTEFQLEWSCKKKKRNENRQTVIIFMTFNLFSTRTICSTFFAVVVVFVVACNEWGKKSTNFCGNSVISSVCCHLTLAYFNCSKLFNPSEAEAWQNLTIMRMKWNVSNEIWYYEI